MHVDAGGIIAIIAAALGTGGAVTRAVQAWRHARRERRLEVEAEARARSNRDDERTERMRIARDREKDESTLAARELRRAHEERRKIMDDRDRLARENASLNGEVAIVMSKCVELSDRVARAENKLSGVQAELHQCHAQHAETAQKMAEILDWVKGNFQPIDPSKTINIPGV